MPEADPKPTQVDPTKSEATSTPNKAPAKTTTVDLEEGPEATAEVKAQPTAKPTLLFTASVTEATVSPKKGSSRRFGLDVTLRLLARAGVRRARRTLRSSSSAGNSAFGAAVSGEGDRSMGLRPLLGRVVGSSGDRSRGLRPPRARVLGSAGEACEAREPSGEPSGEGLLASGVDTGSGVRRAGSGARGVGGPALGEKPCGKSCFGLETASSSLPSFSISFMSSKSIFSAETSLTFFAVDLDERLETVAGVFAATLIAFEAVRGFRAEPGRDFLVAGRDFRDGFEAAVGLGGLRALRATVRFWVMESRVPAAFTPFS
mmetsp:Transcript_59297/g.134254  ORF Transcript_59297/g.134254 Transcript_59297/m.134254 type:complete len:317 (-) Transcript_59297:13-963(-)